MSWRQLLPVLAGFLLPLPLVLAVGAWRGVPGAQARVQDPSVVSPILSIEERRAFMTHERPCQKAEDCEFPLGCMDLDWGHSICMASECQTDLQCADGFTCRSVKSRGSGPVVRTCVVRGLAREGEPCSSTFTFEQEAVCRPGLVCNDYCGRPCQPDTPGTCPEDSICLKGSEGPSCMPTCEGRTCPEGQECVRFKEGFSVCARIWGDNCQRQDCPEGTSCSVGYLPGRPGEVEMECTQWCGKDRSPCPEGNFCEHNECRRPCDREDLSACSPKETCAYNPRTRRSYCAVRLSD